jgi:flagellum-specific peptidoglycan hydrolase FlgJ
LQFLQLVAGPALESERAHEIPACITIAQAILESGWGRSKLFIQANNPFGIKQAHHAGVGASPEACPYTAHTLEYNGATQTSEGLRQPVSEGLRQPHEELAEFQRFPALADAFDAHAQLLSLPRYEPAMKAVRSPKSEVLASDSGPRTSDPQGAPWARFAEALQACGYSTDPAYAAKLANLVRAYRLDDPRALAAYATGEVPNPNVESQKSKVKSEV